MQGGCLAPLSVPFSVDQEEPGEEDAAFHLCLFGGFKEGNDEPQHCGQEVLSVLKASGIGLGRCSCSWIRKQKVVTVEQSFLGCGWL